MFNTQQFYKNNGLVVNYSEFVKLKTVVPVYFRTKAGKLSQIDVADPADHEEAIASVQEALEADKEAAGSPVLAFIKGGKK